MNARPAILSLSLLLCNGVPVSADTDFGRLFTNAAQRGRLDQLRAALSANRKIKLPDKKRPASKNIPSTRYYSIKGVVKRSDGKDQVWINEQSLSTGSTDKGYHLVRNPDGSYSVRLRIPGKTGEIRLKPGQTYLLDSDKTLESYDVTLPGKTK